MSTTTPATRWRPEDEEWDPTLFLQAGRSGAGRRLYRDTEGNGLLRAQGREGTSSYKRPATRSGAHAALNLDTGEEFYWGVEGYRRHVGSPWRIRGIDGPRLGRSSHAGKGTRQVFWSAGARRAVGVPSQTFGVMLAAAI